MSFSVTFLVSPVVEYARKVMIFKSGRLVWQARGAHDSKLSVHNSISAVVSESLITVIKMADLLTPKQVARALGISESSLKRWCDADRIPSIRTAGNHRRLRLSDVIRLAREGKLELQHPEALGLPVSSGSGNWTVARGRDRLKEALLSGNYEVVRQISFDLFLAGHSIAKIADDVFASSMQEIGQDWESKKVDIYQERRASNLLTRALHNLQHVLPQPPMNSLLALGGAVENDPYTLPTLIAEIVLYELGYKATSLGNNLPFASLTQAIVDHQPRLIWLSASAIENQTDFLRDYAAFYEVAKDYSAIVVGGRALTASLRKKMKFAAFCEGMQELVNFATAIRPQSPSALPTVSDN